MLGQSSLGIGLTMFLRDQFSGPASKIKASAAALTTDMRKMQEEQLRYQRNMNMGVAFIGGMALRGMGRAIKMAAEYGYEMEFVKSVTNATGVEQKKLTAIAERLAGETMFFPKDIAEGMRYMAMAGMEAPDIMKNIEGAVALAGSTMSQLGGKGGAADIMTNVMKQFNIDFKYTGQVADILSYATTRANTDLFDLGEALKYAGSTSMDLGISLQESAAMVMALGNAGMQGSMAGVAMENSMRYLTKAFGEFGSGTSKAALAEIGMTLADVTDQSGNLLSMTKIMQNMGKAIDETFGSGMNMRKQDILTAIFGVRGKRAASLFLRNLKEFEKFTAEVTTQSGGHSARIMEDMMSTLFGEHDKLVSELQSTWIAFTEALSPFLIIALKGLTAIASVLTKIFKTPFLGDFLAPAIAGFITIRTVSAAYAAVVAGLKLLHLQTGGSVMGMASQTVAGYGAMTAAANTYRASAAGVSMASGSGGNWGYNKKLFKGTGGYFMRGPGGGMTMSKSAGTVGKAVRGAYGMKAGLGAASMMGLARGAAGTGGKAVISGLLGRVVGFLGGPLGIALSFVLPGLIGMAVRAIKGNQESTDENTEALAKRGRMEGDGGMQYVHAIEFLENYKPKIMALSAMGRKDMTEGGMSKNFEEVFGKSFGDFMNEPKKDTSGDMIINLDGDQIFKAKIIDIINREFQKAGM